jgi:hypothetical protein
MNRKQQIVAVAVGMVILFVAWLMFHRTPDSAVDHAEGFHYVCQNPTEKHEFTLSTAAFNEYVSKHPGEYIKCPKCGADAMPVHASKNNGSDTKAAGR